MGGKYELRGGWVDLDSRVQSRYVRDFQTQFGVCIYTFVVRRVVDVYRLAVRVAVEGFSVKASPITLDFETEPIQSRPRYPPKPVSFSLKMPGMKAPRFYAWAHKSGGNNCTLAEATTALKQAYDMVSEATPLLCQNAKFDLDVAEAHFGLRLPDWRCFEDSMFLLFLDDPHQRELGLKPSAERLLGLPPEEQDKVKAWILDRKKQLEQDFPEIVTVHGGIKPSTAGAFIAYAPGNVVAPYADGDVTRTEKLFKLLYKSVCVDRGMMEAYEREKRLLPILLRNEREGIHVDTKALERDQTIYEAAQTKVDAWIRKHLKAPTLDLDKDAEVAKALKATDSITEWTQTATGRDSVSKKYLKLSHFRNKKLAAAYSYRQKCATMLETFIRPWQHYQSNGSLYTTWNQVHQPGGGTRTGRVSTSKPNVLNIPRNMKEEDELGGFIMPSHIPDLPMMPNVRDYILPDQKGHILGRRDFNSQEVRVLAHFEDALLLQAYRENPYLDVHEFVRQQIQNLTGIDVGRSFAKTLTFGYIYGQGLGSLAEKLGRTVDEVRRVRDAQMRAVPGMAALNSAIKRRFQAGEPIRTWGGREYYCEPPLMIDGRLRTFEYKGVNVEVQGSSADLSKETLIRYDEAKVNGRLVLHVYDDFNISCPKGAIKKEMLILRDVMLSLELDVPLISDGEIGPTLGKMVAVKEPKPDLSRWRL
jgi:DNA polymerase I-like protein with 3'-5' exonuclease and polymerase domains